MINTMKKLFFVLTTLTVFLFSSCDEENEGTAGLVEALDLETESTVSSNYEDVDDIVEAGMNEVSVDGARMERNIILDCAVVTKDTINKVITVDYGEGCEGPYGRIRKGKVIIEYNDRRIVFGAFRKATLENFYVDEVKVEGVRMLTNISDGTENTLKYSITLEGGKLTFADSTTMTREVDRERTLTFGENFLEDYASVEGTANGTRRDGLDYSVVILEPIVYKRDCRARSVFIPVSGVKEVTYDGKVARVDYGEGTCDNEVTITIDGTTTTRNLRLRGSI